MKYTSVSGQIGGSANYSDHYVCLGQLWSSEWGYGGSTSSCVDGMSFKIGKIHILTSLLASFLVFSKQKKEEKTLRRFYIHLLLLGLVSTIMMLSISEQAWRLIPGFAYIQYPWRLLTYVVFVVSVLSGGIVTLFTSKKVKVGIVIVLTIICIGVNAKLFSYQFKDDRRSEQFTSRQEISYHVSGISDEYLPKGFTKPTLEEIGLSTIDGQGNIEVLQENKKNTFYEAIVRSSVESEMVLHQTFFPGWKYYINSTKVEPIALKNGMFPVFTIQPGISRVTGKFTNTTVRLIGNFLSLATVVVLCYYSMYVRKKA